MAYDACTPQTRRSDVDTDGNDRRAGRGSRALHLGVTGHRSLEHEDEIRRQINLAIDVALTPRSADSRSGARRDLVVVSALAEGADRLVAQECLRRDGATLTAVLPLAVERYEEDFATAASRAEFADLLARAAEVQLAEPMPTRDQAYERAGQMVVEQSDIVIAVWNGLGAAGRGGTADTVAFAHTRGVPVIRIDSRNLERHARPKGVQAP